MPPLMTWRVVSSPPMRMSRVSWTSESSSSESPSISAWQSTPTRSSVLPVALRSAKTGWM